MNQGGYSAELEILYWAISTPLGLVVQTTSFQLAQARLYKARGDSGDPELDRLQLRRSPHGEEDVIWIVKGPPRASANGVGQ